MNVIAVWFEQAIEVEKLSSFAEAALTLTPEVALAGKNGVVLEITRSLSLFSKTEMVVRLRSILQEFDLDAHATLAEAQSASVAIAFAKTQTSEFEKLPLEVLSDLIDPFQSDLEKRKQIEAEMRRLAAVARVLGIENLGDFLVVSSKEWASRLGFWGERASKTVQDLHSGRLNIAWPRFRCIEKISETAVLSPEDRVLDLESASFALKSCVDRIHRRLQGRMQALVSLSLEIELEYGKVSDRLRRFEFRFLLSQNESRSTLTILRERLAREFDKNLLSAPLVSVRLQVEESITAFVGQKNFFHRHEERAEALSSLINRLSSRLSMPRVFKSRVHESHLPEKSWKKTFDCASPDHNHKSVALAQSFGERPLVLLSPPRELTRCGMSLFSEMKKWTVASWEGPERIVTEWWNGEDSRDYFKVVTREGETLWVYRAGSRHAFFLHGVFA